MELNIFLIAGIFYNLFLGIYSQTSHKAAIAPTTVDASSNIQSNTVSSKDQLGSVSFVHVTMNISVMPTAVMDNFSSSDSSVIITMQTQLPKMPSSTLALASSISQHRSIISSSVEAVNSVLSSADHQSNMLSSFSNSIETSNTLLPSLFSSLTVSEIHTSQLLSGSSDMPVIQSSLSSDIMVRTASVHSTLTEMSSSSALYQPTTPETHISTKSNSKSKSKSSATAIVVLVFFAVIIIVIGIVCYRRRKKCGRFSTSSGGVNRASYQRFTDDLGGEMDMTII